MAVVAVMVAAAVAARVMEEGWGAAVDEVARVAAVG